MKNLFNSLKPYLMILSLIAFGACSQPAQKTYDDGDEDSSSGGVFSSSRGDAPLGELVTVPVTMIDSSAAGGFSLANPATGFTIQLTSCASGYTGTATHSGSNPGLEVYKYDRDCLAKLTAFSVGGNDLVPSTDFTTWAQGDTAIFDVAAGDGSLAMNVTVISTLANPVTGAETVSYQFSEIDDGGDTSILEATLGTQHTLVIESQEAPNFTVAAVAFLSTTAAGAGQFTFTLNCGVDLGVTTTCDGLAMADIKYMLVKDTYSSTMNIGEATALDWTNDGVSVANMLDNTDADATNGGFITATIDGPDAMATNPNMILLLEADGVSYTYFNIDVSNLTQD